MKPLVAIIVVASALLAGCGSKTETVKAISPDAAKPVAISTAAAVSREVPASFEETGSFLAEESSDVAPQVAGRVILTPVDIGTHVTQGQVICELDHRDAQLKLDQAKAQLAEATAMVRQMESRIGFSGGTFDPNKVPEVAAASANLQSAQAQAKLSGADAQRYANLVATGDVSRSAYEKARTSQETAEALANSARQQYESASNGARQSFEMISTQKASWEGVNAQLAQAEKALADTTIRAPFDGYITARPVAVSEYVALTSKIATIVRISTIKLDLQTPEQRAAQAHVGDKVTARVSAFPDRRFTGRVIAVNPSIDPNSRVFTLEARFDNPDAALKPGMFTTAVVQQPGGVEAVFIPRSAVARDKTTDSNQAFVIQNGKARLRVVQTGDTDGDSIRILSGITAGETVAASNVTDLYDGASVSAK